MQRTTNYSGALGSSTFDPGSAAGKLFALKVADDGAIVVASEQTHRPAASNNVFGMTAESCKAFRHLIKIEKRQPNQNRSKEKVGLSFMASESRLTGI